jgi:serine/threonine protein kinase
MQTTPDCPEEHVLLAFAANGLDSAAAQQVREHLVNCEHCRSRSLENSATAPADPVAASATALDPNDTPALDDAEFGFLTRSANEGGLGRLNEYEVLGIVGRGGMGIVFKAFDEQLQRPVAIKMLARQLAAGPKARNRFIREARAAAAINHPNVVTIHAVSETEGVPFIVMEYVEGRSLAQRIAAPEPLEMIDVLRVTVQIAEGLAAAHGQGVIHRDIKPANIMLANGIERVKITDFGIARVALDQSDLTSLGTVMGTPSYMAPEQVDGDPVDARTDLFSLGCVIYAMVTGKSPFQSGHVLDVLRKVVEHTPAPLYQANRAFPRELSNITMRLLEKDPDERFQTAAELAELLTRHLAEFQQAQADNLRNPPTARRRFASLRHPRTLFAGGAALCLSIALGIWWLRPPTKVDDVPRPNPPAHAPPADQILQAGAEGSAKPPNQPPPSSERKPERLLDLTVAKTGDAQFRSLNEALERAAPGAVVRVLDDAVYDEAVSLSNPDRWKGVTLEALKGATWKSSTALSLATIAGTSGITLRGFRMEPADQQHAVIVVGSCSGLVLEQLEMNHSSKASFACVVFNPGTCGTPDSQIVLRRLRMQCGNIGIALIGSSEQPIAWVRVEECRFAAPNIFQGAQLTLEHAVHDIVITRNLFTTGLAGVGLAVDGPHQMQRLAVRQNTFFRVQRWLSLHHTPLEQDDIAIESNLILDSHEIYLLGQDLGRVAGQWFRNNWWERSADFNVAQAEVAATIKTSVPLLSRKPEDSQFLQPTTLLLPEHVGALLPPATPVNRE